MKIKTKYMTVHLQARIFPLNLPQFLINNIYLDRVLQFKFLGEVVDLCSKFQHHVEIIKRKITKYVPLLYRIEKKLNRNILLKFYLALILTNIIYCVCGREPSNSYVLKLLQSMHDKVLKAIFSPDIQIRNALELKDMKST